MEPIVLGIDPGTKYLGAAVIQGRRFLAGGVHTLKNGTRPHDVVGQAKRAVLNYIAAHEPATVVIEKPLLLPTKRAALVSVIAQELHERAVELGVRVVELSARDARSRILGNPRATKFDVAYAIVDMGFEELRSKLPPRPHPVLGYSPRDLYWLHMFDATVLALAST